MRSGRDQRQTARDDDLELLSITDSKIVPSDEETAGTESSAHHRPEPGSAASAAMIWGGRGARNCMACKRSGVTSTAVYLDRGCRRVLHRPVSAAWAAGAASVAGTGEPVTDAGMSQPHDTASFAALPIATASRWLVLQRTVTGRRPPAQRRTSRIARRRCRPPRCSG
jgi:hypothetical protein